ncbi:MAG: hypothetical protein FD153_1989 [Rhodospirillaceae bacterium]|nr:MAG: hypothetical protein FD153_1989 [Rhodospirillaceae bacterium]
MMPLFEKGHRSAGVSDKDRIRDPFRSLTGLGEIDYTRPSVRRLAVKACKDMGRHFPCGALLIRWSKISTKDEKRQPCGEPCGVAWADT